MNRKLFLEAVAKRNGNVTTKMTKEEEKQVYVNPPKWIRDLTDAQKKKYINLLRRFTLDAKSGGKKPEVYIDGWRIPTNVPKKIIEPMIKEGKKPEEIAEALQGTKYKQYYKEKISKKKVSTTKTLKSGVTKEKPFIGKLESILDRSLTDREKIVATYLYEKLGAYKWDLTELSGLLDDENFQQDIKAFEPWDGIKFAKKIAEKEKEERKAGNVFDKDPHAKAIVSRAMRQADLMELIDFLKKEKLFTPSKANESFSVYLKRILSKLKTSSKFNHTLEFISDSLLSSLQKGWFPQRADIATLSDLEEVISRSTENAITSTALKQIGEKEAKQKKKELEKLDEEDRAKNIKVQKAKLEQLAKEFSTNSSIIEVPAWTSQVDINKYIRNILIKLSTIAKFSRDVRQIMTSLSTSIQKYEKPKKPINNLKELGEFLKVNTDPELISNEEK